MSCAQRGGNVSSITIHVSGYNGSVAHIALDARLAHYRRESGIGQYIVHLAHWLPRLDPDRVYTILRSRKDRANLAAAPNARRFDLWTPSHHRFEQLALPIEMARVGCDLLHSPDFIPPLHTLPCPVRGRYRRVITVHDLTFLRYPHFLTAESRRYYNGQITHAVTIANHILADSHATKADLIDLLGAPAAKITVVWLAPDARFRPQPPRSSRPGWPDRYLLFVGAFEPRKNVAGLLSAYRILLDRNASAPPLVIAGRRGWLFDETLARVERLGLRERVLFLDAPADDDLVALYNGAAMLVQPSHYEGFGLPVLEGMACGVPVVISDRGSLPEIAGGAALAVNPDDAGALADAIERLLDDPTLGEQLRQKGLARAAAFTWERCARETLDVYNSLIDH